MTFDTSEARRYGQRELRPDDSYHADQLLQACDEIDRLRAILDANHIPSDPPGYTPPTTDKGTQANQT